MPARRSWKSPIVACVALAALSAGCSEGTRGLAEATGFATTAQESKAFVRESRPAETAYIPVGTSVTRTAPRKEVNDFKALEAELERKRLANEVLGAEAKIMGATPPPQPARPAE